jgi:hypothetical protein
MLTCWARRVAIGCGGAFLGLLAAGCSSSGSSAPGPDGSPSSASAVVSTSPVSAPAPGEAIVRSQIGSTSGADHFGWVYASAKDVLATYYPPGSKNYIGGRHVEPTDRIIVIKEHGLFDHSAPPGAKSTATLALSFYNATTGRSMDSVQMWDGDAPDLGVGYDPGIANRELAAQRWDLRLVGTPTVRTS